MRIRQYVMQAFNPNAR